MSYSVNNNIRHFLKFIIERQNVFMSKAAGDPSPWTDDNIISSHKFTNVYRFLDFESQFLLKNVIGSDDRSYEDTVVRIILFKIFNLSSTWEYLESELGEIKHNVSYSDVAEALDNHTMKIFSNAYMSTGAFIRTPKYKHLIGNYSKHRQYMTVVPETILSDEFIKNYSNSESLEDLFNSVKSPGFGDFTSYQYIQDLNYSKFFNHDMNSFIKEGPGSIRGVERCFDNVKKGQHADIIKWTFDNLDNLFDQYGMTGEFKKFNGHPLQLPDIQNCFCESDKYMRGMGVISDGVAGKTIKQKYNPANKRSVDMYVAPPKWGIEPLICK